MKTIKKIATLILAVCLVVPCFSMLTYAANARLEFEDPTTSVGETLKIMGVIKSPSGVEDRKVVMSYDTSKLKFVSGEDVVETTEGQLVYELKGVKNGDRAEFKMFFQILEEGVAVLKAESAEAYTANKEKITWTSLGSSTITINPGQATNAPTTEAPTTDVDDGVEVNESEKIEIDGVTYTVSDKIPSDEIPDGFVNSLLEYKGTQLRIVKQESTGLKLAYLIDESGEGDFFLYIDDNATFAPFVQIEISKTTTITIYPYIENITMPEPYVLSNIKIEVGDEKIEFPAWQNSEDTELCVLYALNGSGQKSFYQYDTAEETYQRFEIPTAEVVEKEEATLMGELDNILGEYLEYVILGVGLCLILLIILIIVLSVKLYNRNAELDEIYDEYGIAIEEEPSAKNIEDIDDEEATSFVYVQDDVEESDDVERIEEDYSVEFNTDLQEESVEIKENEVEDDVLFEKDSTELAKEEKDMVELDFDILFSDEMQTVSEAEELGMFDDDEDDFENYDEEDMDFEVSFLDFDD